MAATNAHIEAEQHPERSAAPRRHRAARSRAEAAAPRSEVTGAGGEEREASADATAPALSCAARSGRYRWSAADDLPRSVRRTERDGRRDPFNSLLTTNELRPTISDLRLTGVLYDHTGRHSVATLRDLGTNAQYRVTTGSTLGRMRVSTIRYTTVVFTIDEFGTTRQDSLVLRDTTKARGK